MKVFRVTTQGDCEGRSTREIGLFQAYKEEQVISYLVRNNIKPYYGFHIEAVSVINCSNEVVNVQIQIKEFGYVEIIPSKEAKEAALKQSALSKLSAEERAVLGV